MFLGSFEYAALMGFFPRLMSTIVLILAFILLFRRVFPDFIRNKIESEAEGFAETVEEISGEEQEGEVEDEEEERVSTTRKTNILALLTGLYMMGGFLFGLLWVSPLYIIGWHRYTGYEWRTTVGIAAVVTIIVYLMMDIFNFTLETGYFFTEIVGIDIPLVVSNVVIRVIGMGVM
jgi:hypothetical protein